MRDRQHPTSIAAGTWAAHRDRFSVRAIAPVGWLSWRRGNDSLCVPSSRRRCLRGRDAVLVGTCRRALGRCLDHVRWLRRDRPRARGRDAAGDGCDRCRATPSPAAAGRWIDRRLAGGVCHASSPRCRAETARCDRSCLRGRTRRPRRHELRAGRSVSPCQTERTCLRVSLLRSRCRRCKWSATWCISRERSGRTASSTGQGGDALQGVDGGRLRQPEAGLRVARLASVRRGVFPGVSERPGLSAPSLSGARQLCALVQPAKPGPFRTIGRGDRILFARGTAIGHYRCRRHVEVSSSNSW